MKNLEKFTTSDLGVSKEVKINASPKIKTFTPIKSEHKGDEITIHWQTYDADLGKSRHLV